MPNNAEKPLRIIHCFRSPVGGIFRHVRDLVRSHHAQGHALGIFCDSSTGGAHEDKLFDEIRPMLKLGLTRIPMDRAITPSDALALWRSYKHFRQLQPDILHAHGSKGGAYARLIGSVLRASGVETARLYCPHGGSIHYDPKSMKGKVFFALERRLERLTDRLIFVSKYERDGYRDKVGEPRCKTALVYNGLSTDEFIPVKQRKDARDFLYIGMMRDLKGPDLFIDAITRLRAEGRAVTAHFVGDGPDKERYVQTITERGLVDAIAVHAAMPAREAFAMAKHVVVPSRAESLPYIVLEAIAAQKPILCTDVGGIGEIFGDAAHRLVRPDDADALTDAMKAQLANRQYQSEATALRETLQQRFSVSVMADDVMAVYRDCLSEIRKSDRMIASISSRDPHHL